MENREWEDVRGSKVGGIVWEEELWSENKYLKENLETATYPKHILKKKKVNFTDYREDNFYTLGWRNFCTFF